MDDKKNFKGNFTTPNYDHTLKNENDSFKTDPDYGSDLDSEDEGKKDNPA